MLCRHYRVSGKVQGVFFRASTRDVALQLGLKGWVRNMPDGSVETLACGSSEQLSRFESWLHQGPPMAIVDKLETERRTDAPDTNGFDIKYS